MAIFIGFDGKSYYALPIYPLLFAAGGVACEIFFAAKNRRKLAAGLRRAAHRGWCNHAAFRRPDPRRRHFLKYSNTLPYGKSVKTERDAPVELTQLYSDMFGWDHLARQIALVYHRIPPSEQRGCAILAGNYGEAGAIDVLRPQPGPAQSDQRPQ